MNTPQLKFIEHNPGETASHAIIWLHGLGADGNDFVPMVEQIKLPEPLRLHFIFPHAPIRPVSLNNGMPMPAWYDLYTLERSDKQDKIGILKSAEQIAELINYCEHLGFSSDKILIAGFSQGGAMALYTALCYPKKLAGVIGLSTYLPIASHFTETRSQANINTPIFLAAGSQDPIVAIQFSRQTKRRLISLGYDIAWQQYPMQHQVCTEEIQDLQKWLIQILADKDTRFNM